MTVRTWPARWLMIRAAHVESSQTVLSPADTVRFTTNTKQNEKKTQCESIKKHRNLKAQRKGCRNVKIPRTHLSSFASQHPLILRKQTTDLLKDPSPWAWLRACGSWAEEPPPAAAPWTALEKKAKTKLGISSFPTKEKI